MDYKKLVTYFFFLVLIILPFMLLPATAAPGRVGGMEVYCGSRCRGRCAKAGFQDRCIKYCGICCRQCKCVPSGTFGNKHQCPCYRDKLSSKGKPKCP
ncbi:peamaclein-like [Raphanus sativus]|uniref:Peamaclein-like n=1 Tax=Raphanus sativus TaxID=3726 RepID=A0A9W3BYB2_RAPSA|nr:peamaclein-like [Raphanus sativus]